MGSETDPGEGDKPSELKDGDGSQIRYHRVAEERGHVDVRIGGDRVLQEQQARKDEQTDRVARPAPTDYPKVEIRESKQDGDV